MGDDVRHLRTDAGITQQALSDAAGIDRSHLSLVERGLREPSIPCLVALGSALGADVSVRLYPDTGPTIHDRTQSAIADALLALAAPSWRRLVEVAVHRPARGVIDVVLHDPAANLFVASEIETRIDRLEQKIRWSSEKAESLPSAALWRYAAQDPSPTTSRLLVLRSTRATRELATRYPHVLAAAYPAPAGEAFDALCGSRPWPGPALLWADVQNGAGRIRRTPPRGVSVGR